MLPYFRKETKMSYCCIKDAEVVPVLGSDCSLFVLEGIFFSPDSADILANKTKVVLCQFLSQVMELVW